MATIEQARRQRKVAVLAEALASKPMAYKRCHYTGVVEVVSADEARACLSGHDSRPLVYDAWRVTPNASYRLIEAPEKQAEYLID